MPHVPSRSEVTLHPNSTKASIQLYPPGTVCKPARPVSAAPSVSRMRSQRLNESLRAIKSLLLLGRPRKPTQPHASLDRLDETITFKCTGEASEEAKHATSDEHTAVLLA